MSKNLLICGAGPVALAAALKASSAGFTVEVVGRPPPAVTPGNGFTQKAGREGSRKELKPLTTTALAFSSARFLREEGLEVAGLGSAVHSIRVKDRETVIRFSADEVNSPAVPRGEPFAHIVENNLFWRSLHKLAAARSAIRLRISRAAEITDFHQNDTEAVVTLAGGEKIRSPLVVAADGRNSTIRTLADFAVIRKDYKQEAIQCVIEHDKPHRATAWEYFLPAGPLALLPMEEYRSAVVWSLPAGEGSALASSKTGLRNGLNRKVATMVGECRPVAAPVVRQLGLTQAATPADNRLALVGDADCAIHPIAGQGFNLALRGVESLINCLKQATDLGLEAKEGLGRYCARRRSAAVAMAFATDTLNSLFSYRFLPLVAARGLGMRLVAGCPPLKRAFIHTAMGVRGGIRGELGESPWEHNGERPGGLTREARAV